MRLIKCKGCGQIISASGEQAYCDARRTNRRVCVVCGSTFTSDQPTSVCSPECAAIRKREWQRRADAKCQPRKRKKEETP